MAAHRKHKQRAQWTGAIGGLSDRHSRSPQAIRRAIPLALVALVALAILLPLSLAGGGGRRPASANPRGGSHARSNNPSAPRGASSSVLEPSGESPEIRKLIALHKPI
jgi:hypothetical protein